MLDALSLRSTTFADFGCGTGRHIRHLLERNAGNIVGVDSSLPMLAQGKRKIPNINVFLLQCGLERSPFRDGSFDFALAALVLSHLADIRPSIREFCRLLKPGGRLIITDLHESFEARGWKRTFNDGASKYAVRNYSHSLDEFHDVFASNGLALEKESLPLLDEPLRPVFEKTGHIEIFEQFKNQPLLIVFQVRKKG